MQNIINKQRAFFYNQQTKSLESRKKSLIKIKKAILEHEHEIIQALQKDLGRPAFETFAAEIYPVLEEIKFMIDHLDCLSQTRGVSTPFVLFPSKSYIRQEPYGVTLIIAPWNFPFQLCMIPLIGAIAAGNCVILKPSEHAANTAQLIDKIITEALLPEHVTVIQGDADTAKKLLEQKFDYIFFTGSVRVGKIVMRAASEHLTPLTLELGGKNPCIVDESIHIPRAMRRITWGKFFNAGQNCTAPDYLLVPETIKKVCITYLKKSIQTMYSLNPESSSNYAHIINTQHFTRLKNLLKTAPIICGGELDEKKLFIAPTLVDSIDIKHPIMQEEIFGPILPIISYRNRDEALSLIHALPYPLACYIFSDNHREQKYYMEHIQSGSIGINDVVVQASSVQLPFGGIGNSGFGSYHGTYSFRTFSKPQAYLHASSHIDLPFRFPPYNKFHDALIKYIRWLKS